MLEKFFTSDSYRHIFFQHAFGQHEAIEAGLLAAVKDKVLIAVASFPSIAANRLKDQTPKYLSLRSYYTFVVLQLTLCISEIMLEKEYSRQPLPPAVPAFLGAVLGKLCLTAGGHADQILVQLLSSNGSTCLEYPDWRRLFNDVFLHVPDASLEATLLPLLRHCAHPVGVCSLLGEDFLAQRSKATFLFTHKFLLAKSFSDATVAQNVFGYLSWATEKKPESREKLFVDTLCQLTGFWGSKSALAQTSVDQHAYLTKAIACGVARLTADDVRHHGEALTRQLLTSLHEHLASPTELVREMGMLLAEIVVAALSPESADSTAAVFGQGLNFEHSPSPEVTQLAASLRTLAQPPELPSMVINEKVVPISIFPKWDSHLNACIRNMPSRVDLLTADELVQAAKNFTLSEEEPAAAQPTKERAGDPGVPQWAAGGGGGGAGEELDSDDDLAPYDLPKEKSTEPAGGSHQAPQYIQECLEGLLSSGADRDPNSHRMETCLERCEKLIREAQTDTMEEVGVELARVLLHLADQFGAYNYDFEELRLNALIACLVKAPQSVAAYLTAEFYERNYSIRQRMDILEVLSNGAQELANLSAAESSLWSEKQRASLVNGNRDDALPAGEGSESKALRSSSAAKSEADDWKAIVQRRIDAKTRVISRGQTKAELERVANRFGPVAGHFFFPLLKMLDEPSATLYLLDKNYLLLGRLLYCLGVILYSAIHTPACRYMAKTLLEVVWCLRSHSQTYVRLSLIYAVSIVAITVPPPVLLADFQTELLDFKSWLEELRTNDPEPEVQRQANQVR